MAAYQKKDIQILGGGLNLLPPGDKTPITDYLQAQNWRCDQEGKLVSRFGYTQKFSIAGAGLAHSACVYGGPGGAYYVGANNSITAPTGSVYYNFGSSAIATGFDGNRIAMVPMNGFMWIMNRGKQGRHSAANGFETWNIPAPISSVAAASAATPSPSGSVTFTYGTQSSAYVHFLCIAGVTYQFVENGYSNAQIPLVMAGLAGLDPNATVTYSGSGNNLVITPIVPNVIVSVSGSDSNTTTNIATGSITSLPNGTYQFYATYASADDSLESNPSPVSASVTVAAQAIALTGVPVSPDARTAKRNIYAVGGTLGQAYLVGTIADNATTTITLSFSDLQVTNNGVVMETDHDGPPAASGAIGPHFNRLFAWSTATNPNRLFYTNPGTPQYFPGSADNAVGNWVNVGMEGEAIVWCTIHSNTLVIYKERSIWVLVGDPDTGYLQEIRDTIGIAGQFAVVSAGMVDYMVCSGGLYQFNLDTLQMVGEAILPLFTTKIINNGAASGAPGSILSGASFNSTSTSPYAVSLGYAMGKLYMGYAERAVGPAFRPYNLMVYHEDSKRWVYQRSAMSGITGFFGFVFDGIQMVGLTGTALGGAAVGLNLDDFASYSAADPSSVPIECVYQSHYEDCGLPDNEKVWLEAVVDFESGGNAGTITAIINNGANGSIPSISLGSLFATTRTQSSFAFPLGGINAKNVSIIIDYNANVPLTLHNIYLYYYVEARLASLASTIPVDLGSAKVKQCKELELDIDTSQGPVQIQIYSDLPGNALAVHNTLTVPQLGRASRKLSFPVQQGFLWKLDAYGTGGVGGVFRLYSARMLMRVIGTYIEAYGAASGFVWDSQEMTFDSGITHIPRSAGLALAALPIKRAREISLEIDTLSTSVTVALLSDLPGNVQAIRFTTTINTGIAGRRFVRIPLPAGTLNPIEGRIFRLQISGLGTFILYGADIEILAVGVYIEAYEGVGGAVYDSRELDLGSPSVKEARELELDIEADGSVSVQMIGDLSTFVGAAATTGRQKVMIPLILNTAENFVEGRLLRLILSSTAAFRLYGARVKLRAFGQYLTADESSLGAFWDSTPLTFGDANAKTFDELRIEMDCSSATTVTVYTDLPGESQTSKGVFALTSGGTSRHWATVPLPLIEGRTIRLVVASSGAVRLYAAQVRCWKVGRYLCATTPAGSDVFQTLDFDIQSERVKSYKKIEIDMRADAPVTMTFFTDQSGSPQQVFSQVLANAGRQASSFNIPNGIRGRLLRISLTSAGQARIYGLRVWARPLNEPDAKWGWVNYPLEESEVLPAWRDIAIPETPADWSWSEFPVNPTQAQWFWAKVLSVEETSETWTWVDIDMSVTS